MSGVLVVGAGGLGSPLTRILREAGVKRITVVDPDVVAPENLHRQILYRESDVGRPKVEVVRERMGTAVSGRRERLDDRNGRALIAGHACVFDGTDNFADKYRLNDLCLELDVPLVHAGAAAFRGQVLVVRRGGPCLRCLLDTPPDAERDECRFTGVFGPAVGVVAALAAAEVLRVLSGDSAPPGLFLADLASGRLRRVRLDPLPGCRCGIGVDVPRTAPIV